MKNSQLTGGLPFPTLTGRRTAARVLKVSTAALTQRQSTSESQHQQTLFQWLGIWSRVVPEFARSYHPANEIISETVTKETRRGRVTYSPEGARRKSEGVKPGMFDVANHSESRGYRPPFGGLFIELKVRDNDLTLDASAQWDQVREMEWLRSQNKSAHVVWSWAEAAALHAWYFRARQRNIWMSIGRFDIWLLPTIGGHDRRCGCDVDLETEVKYAARI